MKSVAIILLVLTLGLLLSACTDKSTEADFYLASARDIIVLKNQAFARAHVTGEVEVINDYFTKDAKVFLPNSEVVTGSEEIAELNEQYVEYGITAFREETTALYGDEELLVEEGRYFMTYGEDGIVENGKYINIWKQENGDWKVHSNIWNSSMPAPQY